MSIIYNWRFCQKYSDEILMDGVLKLKEQPLLNFDKIENSNAGNYLISNKERDCYIGEGKNLKKRLKQQSKISTSTFYKNYKKKNQKSSYKFLISK